MTSTLSAPPNTDQRAAIRRIAAFRQRFGEGHFYLACHAALPLALTPDLLYCLWVNFQQDSHQELLDVPWIAVSDLILSNLCEEVGYELYEMDASIRNELLKQLQHDSRFGLKRIRELADFMMAYVEQELDHPDLDTKDLAQMQKLRALALVVQKTHRCLNLRIERPWRTQCGSPMLLVCCEKHRLEVDLFSVTP